MILLETWAFDLLDKNIREILEEVDRILDRKYWIESTGYTSTGNISRID